MAVTLRFSPADLLRCRFAISPMLETLSAVRLLSPREGAGPHRRWLDTLDTRKLDLRPIAHNAWAGWTFCMTGCSLRVMQAQAPPLLPLLRSRLQAELLTVVLLSPGREWTLTELAGRVGASVSSAQREVARAEQAGVVSSRRLGNTRLVTVADSPLTGPLTELLLRSFGPRQVLAEALAGLEGIEAAYLFGSWAARYAGQEGRAPADLDVLVIGRPDRDELDEAAQRAGARLAREVNVTIRTAQWWRDGGDAFHAEVTRRPIVPILESEGAA